MMVISHEKLNFLLVVRHGGRLGEGDFCSVREKTRIKKLKEMKSKRYSLGSTQRTRKRCARKNEGAHGRFKLHYVLRSSQEI